MEQHTIVHFEIPADDPERAVKFYRELFGWEIAKYEGSGGGKGPDFDYWMVRTVPSDENGMPTQRGVNGGLMKRMAPGQAIVNYIDVEDVDAAVKQAERLGGKVVVAKMPVPGMGWFAQINDPEGNLFAVWQTDSNAGEAAAAAAGGETRRGER